MLPAAPRAVLSGRTVGGMRCATRRAVDAVHVEIFVDRKVLLLPAGIGLRPPLRRAGLARLAGGSVRLSAAHARPDRHGLRRALGSRASWATSSRSGASGSHRAGCSRSRGRVRAFRNGREWRGDPRRMPLAAARLDRARDRRLRPAARALPVPGGPVRLGRACGALGRARARGGRLRRRRRLARAADVAPAKEYKLDWQGPASVAEPGSDDAAVRRAHARREGPDAVPHGRGPAHGRAPDHRARRPLDDRPQAPADPGRAGGSRCPSTCRAPAATTCSSTSIRPTGALAQLPAHARAAGGHGRRQGAAAARTRPSCTPAG